MADKLPVTSVICNMAASPLEGSRFITGLSIAPLSGLLLVGTNQRLLAWTLVRGSDWTPDGHGSYPPRFRAAVRELVRDWRLGQEEDKAGPSSSEPAHAAGVWSMSREALEEVIRSMAAPITSWMHLDTGPGALEKALAGSGRDAP